MKVPCSESDLGPGSEHVQPKLGLGPSVVGFFWFSPLRRNESKDCSVSVWVQRCDFQSRSGLNLVLPLCQPCCERLSSHLDWSFEGGGVRLLCAVYSSVPLTAG